MSTIEVRPGLIKRLERRARAHHTGLSVTAEQLLEEGLRMEDHPGVFFQTGPSGRRAKLSGGPDVWEVASAVEETREANPDLDEAGVQEIVVESTSVSRRQLDIVMRYWAAYPDEINERVRSNAELRDRLFEEYLREQQSRPS